MSIVRWRPHAVNPFEEMEKMFEDFGPHFPKGFTPALDIYQDKNSVIVETAIPGVDPEQINISIENDVLTIEGKSEQKSEVEEKEYYRKEVRHGSFHRAVSLPAAVEGDNAKADYEDGILKITIPKAERAKPKTIKIKAIKKK